ncbi:hypothetical protein E2C01_051384 [Portunus trituberculatus]|uniref:Uncharacterized protein n=1 Tax=Portunus trituberculatus TaxID=210409 RepID=A0A5B7GJ23_PORTR|nr:hypothetical protein [Portunus trituberculatus]
MPRNLPPSWRNAAP